ncbi:MAG TPA: aminotransferase class III-fold pyridoxal phosphate-dependent enzyme, partial [Bacilli bacterium]|nr:aminotransferase class III-fold pyridoxal phosphate-dependent enzyme [Bacilli bacterium]
PFGDHDALEAAINQHTAAFLIEPIQGEAGVRVPPQGYLQEVREICTKHNVLLIADEIQSGLGRVGAWFASDLEQVVPDMYVLGKALGGGMLPVSAVAANRNVLGVFEPGSHGSTFGGNPLAAAVACAALEVLEEEELIERSRQLGEFFMTRLKEIKSARMKEIRGKGLFIGIELYEAARPFCEKLMKRGLLCKETHERVIRLAPPLTIEQSQLEWAYEQLKAVLTEGKS